MLRSYRVVEALGAIRDEKLDRKANENFYETQMPCNNALDRKYFFFRRLERHEQNLKCCQNIRGNLSPRYRARRFHLTEEKFKH